LLSFAPATTVDHLQVIGTCASCHNGVTAPGKTADHIASGDTCEDCHSVFAFAPAVRVDHSQVIGTCSDCHNGTTALGKSVGHFGTQLECDHCHSTNAWLPLDFEHQSATYPGDHGVSLICNDCHTSNADTVPWPFPAFAPDCAACHASDYRPDPHRNATVSELRDCAGTCHRSTPAHRVTSRDW
jgi:hypothetical protein